LEYEVATVFGEASYIGRIVEFRVMIRPLQAINAVHQQMRAMLASMQP
jgi:hypothetical protein